MSTELASAYISLIPSFKGGKAAILDELGDVGDKAGTEAGEKAGGGFSSGLSGVLKGGALAVGALAAGALMKGFTDSLDTEAASDKLAAQLGAGGQYAEDLGAIAGKLYGNAYGESLGEVNEAIKGVIQQGLLPEDATNGEIEGVTAKVLDLAAAFDQDLGGATAAVGQLLKTGMAKDANEAFDIITRGFQQGVDKSGDYLDTLTEYGTQFRKLGIDGKTATGILSQGLKGGARDADVVADALKEFSIRAVDGSELTAEGFKAVGLSGKKMTEQIAKGGPGAAKALQATLDGLRGIKDPAERSRAAVALFGTQAEDLGDALYAINPERAAKGLGDIGGAAEKMGDTLNNNTKAKIEAFKRQGLQKLAEFVGEVLIPAFETAGKWLGEKLPPYIETARAAFETLSTWVTGTFLPALERVNAWLRENILPIFQLVAAFLDETVVPALLAIYSVLWEKWQQAFMVIYAWIKDSVLPKLTELTDKLVEDVTPAMEDFGASIHDDVIPNLKELAAYIGFTVVPRIAILADAMRGPLATAAGIAGIALRIVLGSAATAAKMAVDGLKWSVDFLWGALQGFIEFAKGVGRIILRGFTVPIMTTRIAIDLLGDAIGFVVDHLSDMWEMAKNTLDTLRELSHVKLPKLPGAGGGVPFIPGFATGGTPPIGTPYLVGENGPEIRIDKRPGVIIPNHKLHTPVGSAANINVQVDARGIQDPESVGDFTARHIAWNTSRRGKR